LRLDMPTRKSVQWNGYAIHISAERRDIPRWLPFIGPIVPYFWDTDINLDMVVYPPKSIERTAETTLQYKWELHDSDDKVVRGDEDSYSLKPSFGKRKLRAIRIGHLKPQQCYRLSIILTDIYGATSEPLEIATFTIKDRDELYMQMFITIFAIIMALIFGFLFRGCS